MADSLSLPTVRSSECLKKQPSCQIIHKKRVITR